ncbi:helix-turn-helix domain-containing protein [Aliarcobacter vitoriensis]|uniref:AraC family transcriptional regulator n=1 Tax=Aliarcobacter vitoriensis TaxID=2011099 RepID=A0A366MRL3_9BACT|nr:AraC family transcriptional regulator [Aliarcobacter vitoriensis]RBQ28938.1 AraC family transcriptional regulator [Aliarcobacter vitoriensis]
MSSIPKVEFCTFVELEKEILNPFERLIHIRSINKNLGDGKYFWYDMGNGIAVLIRNFTPNQDITLIEQSGGVAGATFIFNLGEPLNYTFEDKEFKLRTNDFFLELISDKYYAQNHLKKGKNYTTFMIAIKKELFLKLGSPIENIKSYMNEAYIKMRTHIYNGNIDLEQFEILNTLNSSCFDEDLLKNLYLESKSMNLLHYTVEKIAKVLNNDFINYDKNRLSSLERAKDIIMKEYSSNLSIKDIAYKSATNECYLKKDFKQYFKMTILDMLQKRRLEVAKELLKDDFNINEVALKVGYKHSGYFSKLFTDYFKITPSEYKKQFTAY